MARFSDDRELNREVKYLYKIWSKVDSRIELPPGLAVNALLPMLDGLPSPRAESGADRSERRKIRFSPQVFNWKSGMTYAAALVLIVALASTMGRGSGELVGGQIELSPPTPATDSGDVADSAGVLFVEREPAAEDVRPVADETEAAVPAEITPPSNAAVEPEAPAPDEPDETLAVGGQSESTPLGEYEEFTLTWRHNDKTDPDKAGYPITVNAADNATGELAFEIDLAGMDAVTGSYLFEDTLALLGTIEGYDGVALFCYDIIDGGEPEEVMSFWQDGGLLDARLYKNVLNIFTKATGDIEPGCEIVALPGANGTDLCVVSAVDLSSVQVERRAFQGKWKVLTLYNLNAYVEYEGEITDDNEEGRYTAQIRLDGMNMELRTEQE